MDVVGHNAGPFELPDEAAPSALVCQIPGLHKEAALRRRAQDVLFPIPPSASDGELLVTNPYEFSVPTTEYKQESVEHKKERAANPQEFQGSLFLISGHADATFNELIRMAGSHPKVVVVGRASGLDNADEELAEDFFNAGVQLDDITIAVPKGYKASDKRFRHSYELPAEANIVYFGGGQQDKLRREFDDHQLEQVKDLLRKGALVGGSSAGAAVMSEEMINGGDEKELMQAHGFGLTPWAILDTHVGQRHREVRDVKALYEIGYGKLPVFGLDEDTRVRFYWQNGKLLGEVGGKGMVHIFQTPDMPALKADRPLTPKISTDGADKRAIVWELRKGDIFEIC